jgi:hypothetical protein
VSIVPSVSQRSRMQHTYDAAMPDTCVRLVYSATPDAYGQPSPTWTAAAASLACGYNGKSREVMDGAQVVMTDGSLRLPIATVLVNTDRIRLTHRHGVALATALAYEIIGAPAQGPMGLVVNLRLVTDGSS